MHIVVVGLMGSGKTTAGRLVAAQLRRSFVDGDDRLEARAGQTAAQFADRHGIDALHDVEAGVLRDALAASEPTVIAPAASTIEVAQCRELLGEHFVAWLRADARLLASRAISGAHRPLGDDAEAELRAQATRRDRMFAAVADVAIDITGKPPEVVAAEILRAAPPAN